MGRTRMYEAIVKGEHMLEAGLPESFNVLHQGAAVALPERRADRGPERAAQAGDRSVGPGGTRRAGQGMAEKWGARESADGTGALEYFETTRGI